jgi:hypothetical protein
MSIMERIRSFWRFLDACATDVDPVSDLAERVARLERQLAEKPHLATSPGPATGKTVP